ncbi:hypothetical protein C5S30_00040 [ANME-1 cluster archaeon GoMg4]|nr:hypothetical protein [ANME-1 cluster archaeon GoMg4]
MDKSLEALNALSFYEKEPALRKIYLKKKELIKSVKNKIVCVVGSGYVSSLLANAFVTENKSV